MLFRSFDTHEESVDSGPCLVGEFFASCICDACLLQLCFAPSLRSSSSSPSVLLVLGAQRSTARMQVVR